MLSAVKQTTAYLLVANEKSSLVLKPWSSGAVKENRAHC